MHSEWVIFQRTIGADEICISYSFSFGYLGFAYEKDCIGALHFEVGWPVVTNTLGQAADFVTETVVLLTGMWTTQQFIEGKGRIHQLRIWEVDFGDQLRKEWSRA